MSKRTHVTKSGDTFEWEETPEVKEAIKKLHSNQKIISELELKAPDYGVGK